MHILYIELLLKLLDMLRRSLRLFLIQAAVAAHPYELEILRCRTSQFARCFLPVYVRAWNGLSDAVFEMVLWVASNMLTICTFPELFFMFSAVYVLVGLFKQFAKQLSLLTSAWTGYFNNNNNNNNN